MELNKYIAAAYKLYAIEEGERDLIEEAKVDHPFQFIAGLGTTLESFENQLVDLKKGDKFNFTIASEDAYGEYNDEYVINLSKDVFEIDGKFDAKTIKEGNVVPLMDDEGRNLQGTVLEIMDDVVVMDMNHPLAGVDLNFIGEVVENRQATAEEIQGMINMITSEGCNCGCDSDEGDCNGHDHGCDGCRH
jgi:FKBP-type peptidyl-prolyl cis-trans isomerase SlyD